MSSTMKIGIVGFGLRAGLWRYAHSPADGHEVTIICDISERGRRDAADRIPTAAITDDLGDVLSAGLDAVLVLTPDHAHAPVAIACLEAGIPTFCEKPLATTIEDADAILTAAARNRARLYVGHNMRHMPAMRTMKDIIDSGRIGEVKAVWCRHFVGHGGDYYFKDWHADRRKSTGLLLQKGAHDIDVIHWLAGSYTRVTAAMGALTVYGDVGDRADNSDKRMGDWFDLGTWPPEEQTGLNETIDVEDISQVNMTLRSGALASYEQCHFTPDYWRNYTVIGTRGRIENFGDGDGDEIGIWDRRHYGSAPPDETVVVSGGDGGHGGADPLLIAEFLRFAREGGPTETSPVAAREAVAVGCQATASLRKCGSALPVPPLDPEVADYFARGQV